MKLLPEGFYRFPEDAELLMPTKEYRELMLSRQGVIIAKGTVWDIKGKNMGAGVYKVTLKRKNYE